MDDLTIFIEKGIPDRHQIRFPGGGDEHHDKAASDLVFEVIEMKHKRFERRGNDLYTTLNLTLEEALLGFSKDVDHLDDHVVTIEKTRVTQPGEVEVIKGEGMPHQSDPSSFGDLFVEYHVDIDPNFTEEQRELWQQFFKDK